ncbi:MAG: cell surface protein SprA, partial [Solirubrobacteraceae bacterium]
GTKGTIEDQSYIDDFENSQSKINLKNTFSWKLASTPKLNPLFPNGNATNNLQSGYQRGLLSWYEIDPSFYSVNKNIISQSEINLNSSRRVDIREIFNNRQLDVNNPSYLNTFDLSFFPTEKGSYNFNPAAELPQERWAGISTPLSITNFENSNIQYVEFWMMDPFSDGGGSPGELLLHLGNVSEDILYDNKMLYENGLVSDTTPTNQVNSTNWGNHPTELPILYAFTTQGESRTQQDIGLDGLNNENEGLKFGASFINPITLQNDPSRDDFINYLAPAWNGNSLGTSLINRYKYFQGTEGNSPTNSGIQTNFIPDAEDLNQDFNLDSSEAYYEFKVKINATDFNTIGNNYITDKKSTIVTLPNGATTSTNWYQFRVPVNQGTAIGGISNLSSVRYLRMIMRGFTAQTTLRLATLELVRGDWAPFTKNIFPNNILEGTVNQNIEDFEISVANIEENSKRNPPYVLPPGISRENLSSSTSITLQQNEQSLSLRVNGLTQDARGVFKKGNYDFRRYNKLKMFVHAENLVAPTSGNIDSDMKVFIRLGTDLVDNYYEYEIPLKYTPNTALSQGEIWPDQNLIEITLQDLFAAKNERDKQPNLTNLILQRFAKSTSDPGKIIYIKGRPSLGLTSNIMIGVRNASSTPKNVLVWVNELRLSGIDKKGSYAGRANIDFNLADLANFNFSGNYSSFGFGGITQTTIQRNFEEHIGYSISSNVNLEKFLPEKWNLLLPMTVSQSRNLINPEYNPLDNDIKFKDISNLFVKNAVQQVQSTKSIAFPTIKKLPSVNKVSAPAIYDIENFSSSFSYSESNLNDIQIQKNQTKDLSISLDYNFSPSSLEIKPFGFLFNNTQDINPKDENKENTNDITGNLKKPKKERFKWIRDFNISPKPSSFSLRTQINRNYNQIDFRDVSALLNNTFTNIPIATTFGNRFIFNIVGSTAFNLTKSFTLNYQVNNSSLVNNTLQKANENVIWEDLLNPGIPVDHSQVFTASYRVPTNYFFNMDWTNLDLNYIGNYNWRNNSQLLTDANLGFIIQNNSNLNTNLGIDFNKIYFKLFKKVKSQYDSILTSRTTSLEEYNTKLQNTKTNSAYNSLFKKGVKFKSFFKPQHYLYSLATSIKNVSVTHKLENGSTLPGFLLEPSFLGLTNTIPSLNYIIGTDFDFKKRAIEQGWVTTSNLLTTPYARTHSQNINASILIEPFANTSINLTFNNTYSESSIQSGFNIPSVLDKAFNNQLLSYNTSYLSIGSAFNRNSTFNNFITIAKDVSKELGSVDTDNDGFTDGYNLTNVAVLIPAFNNALNRKSSSNTNAGLRYRGSIPLPNWNINYTGLNSIPWFMKRFSQIDITHSYQSNYVMNGIQSNPNFYAFENGTLPAASNGSNNRLDLNGNFHNKFLYQEISVTESFTPLIGIDVKFRNNIQLSTKYNRNRITTLGLTNFSIAQDFLDDIALGIGYTLKNVKLGKGKNRYKGDILLRTDLSFIRNKSKIYNFLTNSENILNDQDLIAIKLTSEFNPTKNLSFRLFYDQLLTKYRISTLFSSNVTRAGISITFNILNTSSNLNNK